MKKSKVTGQTWVADVSFTPLDVGFDVRLHDMQVEIPQDTRSCGYEQDGETWLVEGTRDEIVAAVTAAGYSVFQNNESNVI